MRNPPFALTGRTTLDIIRRAQGQRVGGRYEPGAESIVPVVCNVQPVLKSTDTILLPESDRTKECCKVYTRGEELRMRLEGPGGHDADRFYWQGKLWEVKAMINYDMGVLNHFKVICVRIEVTG